jgi:CSLREA domain-containing protein
MSRFKIPSAKSVILVLALLVTVVTAAILLRRTTQMSREAVPEPAITIPVADVTTVKTTDKVGSFLRVTDGRNQATTYKGSAKMIQAVRSNQLTPLTLSTADFNRDGFADLISAYSGPDGGFLTLQEANPAALSPTNPNVIAGISQQRFPAAFREDAAVFELPIAPDFVESGDFTRDGNADVVVAARGGNELFLLVGDGHGKFSSPQRIALPGTVAALAAGDINRSDEGKDLVVATSGPQTFSLVVFDGKTSLLEAAPLTHSLAAEPRALAVGQLDDDAFGDVAVVVGDRVSILHGWAEALPTDSLPPAASAGKLKALALPVSAKSITLGDLVWDRENRTEIAIESLDGAVQIAARGSLDQRPLDADEIRKARLTMAEARDGKRPMSDVLAKDRQNSARAERWNLIEEIPGTAGESLLTTRMSARSADDLLVMNHASRQIRVMNQGRSHHRRAPEPANAASSLTLQSEHELIAALPMKLNVDGRPGLVILSKGSITPSVLMPLPVAGFVVTKNADTNDGTCDADCSLREAIVASNANGTGADTITFNAGINPVLTIPGSDNAAAEGDLDINGSLTITGNAGNTIIDTSYAAGCGDCKVFGVNQSGTFTGLTVSFNNLTIQDGFNDHAPTGNFQETGGGIDFFLTGTGNVYSMTNCVVTSNVATNAVNSANSYGGGINIDSGVPAMTDHGSVTLTGCTISSNQSDSTGGGISARADLHNLTINSSVITGNTTTSNAIGVGAQGGGIDIRHTNGGTVLIQSSSTISNNTARGQGGGICSTEFNVATNITIANSTISGNTSQNSGGPGLPTASAGGGYFVSGNTVMLNTVNITGNHSDLSGAGTSSGGGLFVAGGTITYTGGSLSNNTANGTGGRGGGLTTNGGTLTMSNVTISGNSATSNGGGVFVNGTGVSPLNAVLNITGGSISSNTSANGAGLATDTISTGATTITNASISSNTGTTNGGGLLLISGLLTLNGVTVDANTATNGDGIHQTGGTFTGLNTINFNSGDSVNLTGGTFNSTAGTMNLTGNFTNSGGSFVHNTGTVVFNGGGGQSLGGTSSSTFNNLTVNKGGGTLTLGVNTSLANVGVGGNLSVSAGIFDLSTFTINRAAGGGTLTVSNGATLKIGGTNTLPSNYNTHSIGATSTIEYSGAGQNVSTLNSAQKYGNLVTSGSATKTLAGAIGIATGLNIGAGTTLDASVSNFAINIAGNWTNNGTFTPRSGTVTFDGNAVGTQSVAGNTTFFNLTIANTSSTIAFGSTTTTVSNTLSRTAGTTMDPGTGTFIFTGASGSIIGTSTKTFNNLQINAGASISNSTGGNTTILNDYTNNGTFTQAAGILNTFATGGDGLHTLSGSGLTTFGRITINSSNTVSGAHSFSVLGTTFTVDGTFTGGTGTVTFSGNNNTQTIAGTGTRNFTNLTINHTGTGGVTLGADAAASGLLTLTSDLTATGILNQTGGTSAGAGDVIGTVRRTDLGGTERSFGNVNNSIQINAGTAPNPMDVALVKSASGTFPANVDDIPRTYTLTATGGSGISATVKLRYLQSEVGSADETKFILWKNLSPWTPQGGTVDTANNFVSLSGVSSFSEWAIAEGSDLTLTKANDTGNAAVTGEPWNWTLTATNAGAPATFTAGQTILSDNLPNSNLNYGTPTVQGVSNISGSANISCSIVSNDLTCTALGGSVTFDSDLGASSFQVVFSATPQTAGSYQNPRGGGTAQVDPINVIVESADGNNTATNNTVTVTAANTTTTISNALSLTGTPSVTGQPVTVQWSVAVNSPGSLGTALTNNVTVSDGTNNCVAAVGAGQCDITFTSAGAKNITATYAGDANYNGSASTPATPHTVNAADTTTTITLDDPDPSTPGQSVTVNYTVTASSPGSGTPTGNVNVTVSGGAETCTGTVAAGTCALVLNTLGSRTITATYVGPDSNFNGSFDTEDHQVCGSSIVTSTADSGAGSLRQVIADACDGDTITFNIAGGGPHTILLSTELVLNKNLNIDNTGGEIITVSGGGGTRVFKINSGKTVTLTGFTVTGGSVVGSGGGILNDHGTLTLNNMTISGNAGSEGGGVYVDGNSGSASLTVTNSTISGNTATASGGGIHANGSGLGATTLIITNSTISGNNADVHGGGLYLDETTSTLTNVTVTINRADNDDNALGTGGGIGIVAGAITTLHNTIVAGNFNEDGVTDARDDVNGALDGAGTNNLIGDGTNMTGISNGDANSNQVGTSGSPIDAGLGLLANNGGPTFTHALSPGSPALEAGSNTAATTAGLTTDQRGTGFPRTADSADPNATQTVDIGAYELHPTIEDITDKLTAEDTLLSFSFTLGDGTGALISSVTATSSNTTLVPNNVANLNVTGAGSSRTLDITPALNANSPVDGTATITVTVTATNGQTAQDTFVLTVDPINDPPSFVKGADQTVDEDAGAQTVNGWATSISQGPNETGQTLTFNITPTGTTGSLTFSSGPAIDPATGNLTYTPTADTNGTANFSVTLSDNGSNTPPNSNTSGAQTFMITVNAINDPPSFTEGPDQNITDGAGPQTVNNWATNISPGPNEAGQILTFNVSPTGSTGTLTFSAPPSISAAGTLTYTATTSTVGTATFDVTLSDNGSNVPPNSNTSAAQSFTITVNPANDPPVNTVPGVQSIPRNTVFTFSGANQISVADVDAAQAPSDGVITVTLTATNGALTLSGTAGLTFSVGDGTADTTMTFDGTIPAINTALNGMTFTPTLNFTGMASVQIVSNDQGKTGPGGVQTDTDTVDITVTIPVDIYINEVLFNPPGTDAPNEYIELRGPASTVIPAGTYFVAIEGDAADNPGDVQTIINLSGLSFGANGFLVILQSGNTYTTAAGATVISGTTTGFGGLPGSIFQADVAATDLEDSSVSFMLIQTGAAPALTNDIDSNDDGLTDGSVFAGWSVRDSINAMNGSANARAYGAFGYRNSAGSGSSLGPEVIVSFIPSYVGRICDSTGSTAADWVSSGVLGGAAPNWTLGVVAETEPASFAGKALNHIGASNFANLAPVNSVPGAQNVNEDFTLTFNAGNANLISISDPDAGTADVKVTLTAVNGTMSLSGTAGLTFTPPSGSNDGSNDTQIVFTGTIANINAALNGMTFASPSNFFSAPDATLTILTEDQGNTGCGGNKSDTDVINITVNAVNDPPSFTLSGNPPTVNEDAGAQTVNSFATSISQGPGETGQTLTFNLTPTGATGNIAFSSGPAINATTGALTYTTSADTNGTATFSVTLSDNGSNVAPNSSTSGAQNFTITVNAVNDAPMFQIPSNPPAVNEDAGAQTVNSFATNFQPGPVTATDEIGQTLVGYTVTPTGTTGNLAFTSGPSINNAGQLTYTPTTNTSGTAAFNVAATDSGSGTAPNVNQSAPVTFTITVNGQNDAPVLDNSGNMSLVAINEDASNASNPGTLISDVILSAGGDRISDFDAGALEGIAVTAVDNTNGTWQFSIDNGTNWTPFGTPDALNARLLAANATTRVRFVPNLNFNDAVNPGITFRAWDQTSGANGNTADVSTNGNPTAFSSATETASITVNPVNDQPSFTKGPDQSVLVNQGAQIVTPWATAISVGPANETGQTVSFQVTGNTNPALFSLAPAISPTGTLTYTSANNAVGSATITIVLQDNGGGTDTSAPQTVVINVAAGNTSTALISSANPAVFGDSVTFTATVTANSPSSGTPLGTVDFKDGATTIGSGTLDASGVATFATSSLAVGSHSITAEYVTSANFLTSTSTPITQVVRANPTVSVSSSQNPSNSGANVTFTATVTPPAGVSTTPTGTVQFKDGGADIGSPVSCAAAPGNTCTAQVSTSSLTAGTHVITADYFGDANFNPASGTLAGGQIVSALIRFSSAIYNTTESSFAATITVERIGDSTPAVSVDYATADDSAVTPPILPCSTPGLVSSRCDFTTAVGTLKFAPAETSKTFTVLISQDSHVEGAEGVTLTLSNVKGNAVLGTQSTATLTIADDVSEPAGNPIDDPQNFVRQHYHDFLNRETDAAGLAFWTNQITSCGADVQCTEVKRINVSAAFFLSIEFQVTGGTAYLTNKVAFGGLPTYLRFQTDAQQLGRGYVFGEPGAEVLLEANKVAYFNEYASRTEFTNTYNLVSDQTYVNTLIGNTGVSFTQLERDALLNGLINHTETRATVLRKIVEKPSYAQSEFSRMFVLMEYFGYLRRNPDAAGFNFWLTKLDSFNGDFIQAEMVKAFLTSIEYRQRFGP